MIKLCDNSSCTGCMSCVQTCNKGAISVRKDEWGFSFPSIDNSKCVECGLCIKKCHISNPCETSYPRSFYSYRGSDEERLKSSSGSFFPLISSFFINKGYYVVGVVYNDDFLSAKYVITQSLEVVDKMRKSKYFEAEIGDI